MKILKYLFALLVFLLVFCGSAFAAQHTLTEHWNPTSEKLRVAWTHDEVGIMFEVKLVWVETSQEYPLGETAEHEFEVTAPRVGHFDVAVRARDQAGNHSTWSVSTNPEVVLDNKPWRIYWFMDAPGPIEISKEVNHGKNQIKNFIFCSVSGTGRGRVQTLLLPGRNNFRLRLPIYRPREQNFYYCS